MQVTDVHLGPIDIPAQAGTLLLDIDGTVADLSHRLHHLSPPKDYDAFEAAMHLDVPITPIIDTVKELVDLGWQVIGCTGRNERMRWTTLGWLHGVGIVPDDLFMRRNKDFRSDVVVKGRMIDLITERYGKPDLAFDDRDRVVDMIRKKGILCAQVALGSY